MYRKSIFFGKEEEIVDVQGKKKTDSEVEN
jgi:hypothetical protein